MSGKNQGKVREFEMNDKWQPWFGALMVKAERKLASYQLLHAAFLNP